MHRMVKLTCFTVWGLFAGYLLYLLLGGPGSENIALHASLGLIGIGITTYFYAVYINVKGKKRYLTLIPIFLGIFNITQTITFV